MNILTVLLFIAFLGKSFANFVVPQKKHYKTELRALFEKEKNRVLFNLVESEFEYIYKNIISSAKQGKTKIHFVILSLQTIYQFKNQAILQNENGMLQIIQEIYKPPISELVDKIVDKLKYTFPDSNITYWKKPKQEYNDPNYYNYYNYYTLSWS